MNVTRQSISVVVVNYNGEKFISDCLESVRRQTLEPIETVVVDNGSTDASLEIIRRDFPEVKLVALEENTYFARGSNLAIAESRGDLVLLLNNDAVLDPEYLAEAVKPLGKDDRIGSVTGKILRADGETLDTTGQFLSRSRKPLDRGYGMQDGGQFDREQEIFGAGGVAPLLRRAMLDDLAICGDIFDEGFVQYYEDLDLFWRARNFGWKSWYTPTACATHHRGGVGQSDPAMQGWVRKFAFANLPEHLQLHVLKNRYATMAKNDRLVSWLAGLPWILFYELKIFTYLLLIKPAMIVKYFKGFGFLGYAFRRRKQLKAEARRRGIRRYGRRHRISASGRG